jgi:predicted nucleic acid-binding protein
MNDRKLVFLDTNIIVYQFDQLEPQKQKQAFELVNKLVLNSQAVISYQVIQEFMNVALKKFTKFMSAQELQETLSDLLRPMCKYFPSFDFYERALSLYSLHTISPYDALIIQAALDLNCDVLYSEDLQDGQQFGNLQVVNPFK